MQTITTLICADKQTLGRNPTTKQQQAEIGKKGSISQILFHFFYFDYSYIFSRIKSFNNKIYLISNYIQIGQNTLGKFYVHLKNV